MTLNHTQIAAMVASILRAKRPDAPRDEIAAAAEDIANMLIAEGITDDDAVIAIVEQAARMAAQEVR